MTTITTLSVKGMTCSACSSSITAQLVELPAVEDAQVSLITEEAIVKHTPDVTPEELKETIEDCGFDANILSSVQGGTLQSPLARTRIKVHGMTCSNCVNSIKGVVEPKVVKVEISLITEEAVIDHDTTKVTKDDLVEMIDDCGFDATLIDSVPIVSENTDSIFQTILTVSGMTCGACTSSIQNMLMGEDRVVDCKVSLVTEQAIVDHYSQLSASDIKDTIEDCGFTAEIVDTLEIGQSIAKSQNLERTNFKVNSYDGNLDMINSINIKGVVSTSLASDNVICITYNPNEIGVRTLIEQVEAHTGLIIEPQTLTDSANEQIQGLQKLEEIKFWKKNFTITGVIGYPMFVVDHLYPAFTGKSVQLHLWHGLYINSLIELVLATYIQFTVGKYFYQNSKKSLKHGSGTMDLLICVSTNISYYFSILYMIVSFFQNNSKMQPHVLFETAVVLMNFVCLGKWMESKAKSETSTSLSKLLSLTSSECTIITNPEQFTIETPGEMVSIPIHYLQIHDIVSIKPGEKVPADGVIISGESEIDESLLTGESLPIYKKVDDKVFGGSINGPGHLFVSIRTTSENSQLAKIIKLVKFAQLQKAPIQSYADYVASIFVPTVLALSVVTFICWLIICNVMDNPPVIFRNGNGKFFTCLKIAITVIVVACPCALGLAAPTAIMVGTGVGATNGVLIKGGDVLEGCRDIDVFLFDKTGTLTLGEMNVCNFERLNQKLDKNLMLRLIGSLEEKSEHPIGEAITYYAKQIVGAFNTEVSKFEVLIGKGLSGSIKADGEQYAIKIGNLKIFDEAFLANDPTFTKMKIDSDLTLAHVSVNGEYIGYMEIKDIMKSDSPKVLNHLKAKGYEVAMVTGDSTKSAIRIAKEVGIPIRNVYAEISPYGKEQLVSEFQVKRGLKVAFIGDGLNDSPALAKADLGIAIASGTDIAIEAADIVILNHSTQKELNNNRADGKLQNVLNAVEISQKTLDRIKWNFFWSSVYNITMVPIAMGVLIPWGIQMSPMFAALAMAFSSVSVVLSSLWLKRWTPRTLNDIDIEDDENVDLELGTGSKNDRRWNFKNSMRNMLNSRKAPPINSNQDVELQTGLLRHGAL